MRELLYVDVMGTKLTGTWHHPADNTAGESAVLILNFGDIRRAGPADMSVHMADRLAMRDHHVFRFDMPGLGDTLGELPAFKETLWRYVQAGKHAPWVCGLIDVLKEQYQFDGFVLAGLCGGAITSIFVAADRPADIKGLVLLEPTMRLTPQIAGEVMPQERTIGDHLHELKRRFKTRIKELSPTGRLRGYLDKAAALRQRLRPQPPITHVPPTVGMFNVLMLDAWRRVRAARIPTLLVHLPKSAAEIRAKLLPEPQPDEVQAVELEHTNHLLISGNGRSRTIDIVDEWMQECVLANSRNSMRQ